MFRRAVVVIVAVAVLIGGGIFASRKLVPAPDTWSMREQKDQMSDLVTRSAWRRVSTDGGTDLTLGVSCMPAVGKDAAPAISAIAGLFGGITGFSGDHMRLDVTASRDGNPVSMYRQVDMDAVLRGVLSLYSASLPGITISGKYVTAIRYRINDEQPVAAFAVGTSDSGIFLLFGKPLTVKYSFNGWGGLARMLSTALSDTAISLPIDHVVTAQRIRIEVLLADGSAPAIELLPRDAAFQTIARSCGASP